MSNGCATVGRVARLLLICGGLFLPTSALRAANVSWAVDSSGTWSTASNWSGNAVPGVNDDVTIDRPNVTLTVGTGFSPQSIHSLTCAENLEVDSTLTIAADSQVTGALTLGSAASMGTVNGNGNLTLSGPLIWTAGSIVGSGKLILAPTAVSTISGNLTLQRNVDNSGLVSISNLDAVNGFPFGGWNNLPGSVFNATVSSPTPFGTFGGSPFNNMGVLNVNLGTLNFRPTLNNTSGTINLYGAGLAAVGGSNGGTINVYPGGTLSFGATFTNTGAINLYGGLSPTTPATFDLSFLSNSGDGSINVLQGIENLAGTNAITGKVTVATGATLGIAGQNALAGSVISGAGAVNFTSPVSSFAGSLAVTGPISIATSVGFNANQTLAGPVTISSGTLSGTGNVTIANALNWVSGTMNGLGKTTLAMGSTTSIAGSSSHTLSRVLENAGVLNYSVTNTFSFAGGSLNNLAGGIINATSTAGSTLGSFNGDSTSAFSNAGTFNQNRPLTISVPMNNAATGVMNINGTALTLNGGGSNSGVINLNAANQVGPIAINATFTNGGIMNFYCDNTSGGELFYIPAFNNTASGTLNLASGTLTLRNPSIPNAGKLHMAAGADLIIEAGYTQAAGSVIDGPGSLGLSQINDFSGKINVTGEVGIGGQVKFNTDQNFLGEVDLGPTGAIDGPANITLNSTVFWIGGNMQGTGKTTLSSAGVMTLVSSTGSRSLNRVLDNAGTINIAATTADNLNFFNGVLNNLAGSTLNASAPTILFSGGGSFNNAGTFNKTSTTSMTFTGVQFNNSGTVNIDPGQLSLNGGFTQTATGRIVMRGGSVSILPTLSLPAGSLEGTGTILSTIQNHATISPGVPAPGSPIGNLIFNSGLTLNSGSTVAFDLGGSQSNQFDQISVLGNFKLGGALSVNFVNGFQSQVAATDKFVVATNTAAISGSFANVANGGRLATADGAGTFVVRYGAGSTSDPTTLVLDSFAPHGDFNLDGAINTGDVQDLLSALADLHTYAAGHTLSDVDLVALGDIDGDHALTNADLQALLSFLRNGSGSVTSVPEPAGWMLGLLATLSIPSMHRRQWPYLRSR